MKEKKSFVLYCDLIHTVKKLPKEIQADLFMIILEYVNDLNPKIEDNLILDVVFEPIKLQLKRDLIEWESIKVERAKSGKKGGINSGESRRTKQTKQTKQMLQNRSKPKQTEANEAVNVNVNVNDKVTVVGKDTFVEPLFDLFRGEYLGTKRGLQEELQNFKKHADWEQVLPTLLSTYRAQQAELQKKKYRGEFVPSPKNLKTYINQRCWTEEVGTEFKTEPPKKKRTEIDMSHMTYDELFSIDPKDQFNVPE